MTKRSNQKTRTRKEGARAHAEQAAQQNLVGKLNRQLQVRPGAGRDMNFEQMLAETDAVMNRRR